MPEIFISYTHKDNEKLSDERYGWIDRFHQALALRLNQLAGRTIEIWRDLKIAGNDALTPLLEERVRGARLFIAVVSPGYLNSDWCNKEFRLFLDAAQKTGGLHVEHKSRLFIVFKDLVDKRPEDSFHVSDLTGYPFYKVSDRGIPRELDQRLPEDRTEFVERLNDLAYHLCKMLDAYGGETHVQTDPAPASGITIYLAETTFDQAQARERLRRELEQFGHTIVPAAPLPHSPDYAQLVAAELAKARLSIHPVGKSYGVIPESCEQSVVELQYRAAAEAARERPEFIRLPWMPPDVQPGEPRQEAFVKTLGDDPRLIVAPLETLKTTIADLLAPKPEPKPAPTRDGGQHSIYLICDPCDVENVKAYDDWLFEHEHFEVRLPLTEGDERQLREDHEENLKTFDAILIYYGHANEFWLRSKLRDLQKAFGYGRTRPFLSKTVLLADPRQADKDRFRSHEVHVVQAFGSFDPERLEPFVNDLNAAQDRAV